MNEGFSFTPCSFLIAISQVLIEIHNGEHVWHVLICILALKCEAVNFVKFKSAGVPVRPFEYLDVPILIIAHAPCMPMHDAHAHRDVTRFAYDANHVTMTSPALVFHLCLVERRWHDVISVRIVGTPRHHGLHCMGMM